MEECDKYHIQRQFNEEFYNAIESVQGQQVVNNVLHARNIHAKRDGIYIPSP
jgi:hypothetical protein